MKNCNVFFIFLSLCLTAQISVGQKSMVDIMTMFSGSNKVEFIQQNHTTKSYIPVFDEEEKVDTTIEVNGDLVKLKLAGTKRMEWKGKELSTTESSVDSDFSTVQIFEFDANSNIIRSETKFDGASEDVRDMMNEKMMYTYDNKNRLTKIQLFKKAMENGKTVLASVYDDTSLLPISADIDLMIKMAILREPIADGFKYHFNMEIPKELLDMARAELGANATDAEVMAALGPFGKIPKKYSDITFAKDGTIKEAVYEENMESNGKVELISNIVFDSNYNILSKSDFEAGENISSITYEYNDKQKVKSITMDGRPKKVNEFDANGNLLKEYSENGYFKRIYRNGKLSEVREFSDDNALLSFELYQY